MIIAIDGPAGSGKSTAAKLLSKKIGFSYLDTGATYRALTLAALERGVDINDEAGLGNLAGALDVAIENEKIYLGGRDVSADIRTPRIDKNISPVVKHPLVREVMVALQRKIAATGNFVTDGRDVTSVVFPNAEYKFYIDAKPEVRAMRRFRELKGKGVEINFEEVFSDLRKRDTADLTRSIGPLKRLPEAKYIDTSDLTIEEVVEILAKSVL